MSEKKTHVPWFAKSEWRQVYEDIYSNESERVRRGYERLLLWKARCMQLPAGMECTIGFIQVVLQDMSVSKEIASGTRQFYSEYDLQVMFSTVVMRFLNFISTVAQVDDTLYLIAKKLNIPEWLVVLRHDAAHSSVLPSLSILRQAVQFGLAWLDEHYWKETDQSLSDWVISQVSLNKNMDELIDIWQALHMYEIDGLRFVGELPDANLQEYLMALSSNKLLGLAEASDVLHDVDIEEKERTTRDKYKILWSKTLLKHRLLGDIVKEKRKTRNKVGVLKKVVTTLVSSEAFLPPEKLTRQLCEKVGEEMDENHLPRWIFSLWKELLEPLQRAHSVFPLIIHQLLQMLTVTEDEHRQLLIALWIKELCLSMGRTQEFYSLLDIKEMTLDVLCEKKKSSKKYYQKFLKTAMGKNPDFKTALLTVPIKDKNGLMCPMSYVKSTVLNPKKFSSVFLPSLLDVVIPTVPAATKDKLLSLVTIYTKGNEVTSAEEGQQIYTVNDLDASINDSMNVCETDNNELEHQAPMEETTQSTSDSIEGCDWITCPLGMLPWQQGTLPVLDMPSHITWKYSGLKAPEEKTLTFSNITQKKLDWKGIRSEQKLMKIKRNVLKRTSTKIKRKRLINASL